MPVNLDNSRALIGRLIFHGQKDPEHDAIVSSALRLSYGDLVRHVLAQAKIFRDAGISADSVVGIKCEDDTQHLIFCLAAIYLGATSCTIPCYETDEMQREIISRCGATRVVDESLSVDPASLDNHAESALAEIPANQARLLFSTSGTTGEPKLVVHCDSDLVAQAYRHIGSEDERFACIASVQHNFVKRHRLYCLAEGATNVMLDPGLETLVAQCHSLDVNVLHVSAFQAQELLGVADISRLSGIRLKLGGSHVPFSLRQQLRDTISENLYAGYGTTETGAIGFTDPGDKESGESVGQPLPGIEVRTVTADGEPLAKGEHGELAIRCDGMFREYLGNAELTAARLKNGWFHTGDIGYLDDRQRIHLCGRSDDMFTFNSMNIYPQEIESQICQHPDVIDAAVLPRASSVHGNIPVALVCFADEAGSNLAELKKFVSDRVGVRSPRQYSVVDHIPRNATGKIARPEVVRLSQSIGQIRRSIVEALSSLEIEPLEPSLAAAFADGETDIELGDIGMDSMARMNLLIILETEYNLIVTPQQFGRFCTLGDVVSSVISQPGRKAPEQPGSSGNGKDSAVKIDQDAPPHIVRLFRRVLGRCDTVAQLDKAIGTLECRLTPLLFRCLRDWHFGGKLVPASADEKFQTAVSSWVEVRARLLDNSGKQEPEPFILKRITPSVIHCAGPGAPADKSLLICFATRGGHQLSIANSALMQHTDAALYDLLIISEPRNAGYWAGVPFLGNNLAEVIEWLERLQLIRNYRSIRTLGCSAGGYPAIVAGYRLGAEMAVCVGGRFYHMRKKPVRNLHKVLTIWAAARRGRCSRVILSYSADEPRDCRFVRIMAGITNASCVAVEFANEKAAHGILTQLMRRGELAPYLQRTIFAEMDDELISAARANAILSFPTVQFRAIG